jgi:ketosteroid isomerase-like protein
LPIATASAKPFGTALRLGFCAEGKMGCARQPLPPFRNAHAKLCAAFLLLLVAAQAQDSATGDASRVMSLEIIWNQAEQQQDTKALENLLGEKFIFVDVDGSIQQKAEFLESIKNRAEHIDAIGVEPGSAKVYLYGDSAVANGIYREKGTLHGKPYLNQGRFTDTWIKQGSAWVCVASQATLIRK